MPIHIWAMEKRSHWITSLPLIGWMLIGICGLLTGCGSPKADKAAHTSPNRAMPLWETPTEWKVPSYQGRTLYEWADIGSMASNQPPWSGADFITASNAIRQIGREGFPWLIAAAVFNHQRYSDRSDGKTNTILSGRYEVPTSYPLLKEGSLHVRQARPRFLAYGLSNSGTDVIPLLLEHESPAAQDLAPFFGKAGLKELLRGAQSTNSTASSNAMLAIAAIGRPAARLGPDLWKLHEKTRNPALLVLLARMDSEPRSAINALLSWGLSDNVAECGPLGWREVAPRLADPLAKVRQKTLTALLTASGPSPKDWPKPSTEVCLALKDTLTFEQELAEMRTIEIQDAKLAFFESLPTRLRRAYLGEIRAFLNDSSHSDSLDSPLSLHSVISFVRPLTVRCAQDPNQDVRDAALELHRYCEEAGLFERMESGMRRIEEAFKALEKL